MIQKVQVQNIGGALCAGVIALGVLMLLDGGGDISYHYASAASTATSTVTVGNSNPTVTNVILNHASSIVLTANTTQNVDVNATISDNNGCGDITGGSTTVMIFRSGITSSTCFTTANDLNCYRASSFTASSTCSSGTQVTTTTFAVQYFAQATDSSSSFPSQNWIATVIFKDPNPSTGTADSSGQELLTLTALNVTTSSINYGTLSASSTTGATNQVATTTNAGNSSSTLQLKANATLTNGANSITTSSQRYSTSSFTFAGTSTALTDTLATVNGFFLTAPTSSTNVLQPTFWGLEVPAGTATGTYNGQTLFSAVFAS